MRSLLDRSWQRPAPTAVEARRDLWVGLVAALVCIGSVELFRSATDAPIGAGGVEGYVLFGLAGLVLAVRRRLPLTTLLVEAVLFIVVGERLGSLGVTFTIQIIMFASLYAAWAWSRRPRALLAMTAVVLVAMFGWLIWSLLKPGGLPSGRTGLIDADVAAFVYSLLINVVYFLGATAWGQAAYRSARRLDLIAVQEDAEREHQRREQERALHDERTRIARDLHDVVAHHVSSIGVQAAGARRVLERDPATAGEALATIESSSREAVTQMHQLVGLLRNRDDTGDLAPQPGLRDLPGLAEAPVEYRVVGDPFPVPETVGLSLFRVAQEAVTNVRRHSGARRASLVVRYVSEGPTRAVEVEVVDDGRGRGAPTDGGYGLRGIAERAALHAGETEIGPRPQGGFRVRVRVPVTAP